MTDSDGVLDVTGAALQSRPASPDLAAGDLEPWPPAKRAWLAVVLVTLAMFMSYVDRTILSLLIEPIKASLHFSDVQMGLLQGLTFGLVFTVTMAPCGWLVDNVNRNKLLCAAIAVWSLMTATCGLAASFAQMFVARMGVAIGEATLSPTAPSLISDYFPAPRRTLPLSMYSMGAGAGVAASLLIGGLVAHAVGSGGAVVIPGLGRFETWQIVFFSLALPGLLLSLLFLIHPEPRRRGRSQTPGSEVQGGIQELKTVLLSRRSILLPHMIAYCLFNVFSFAVVSWLPAFFMRLYGWSIAEVGIRLGTVQLVTGIVGSVIGGQVARSFWRRGRKNANLLTAALFLSLMTLPAVAGTMARSGTLALISIGLMYACLLAPAGPLLGAIQDAIPGGVRGRVTALYCMMNALVGMTLGPLVVGILNDKVFVDPHSVGKSLALTTVVTLPLAGGLLAFAARQRSRLNWAG